MATMSDSASAPCSGGNSLAAEKIVFVTAMPDGGYTVHSLDVTAEAQDAPFKLTADSYQSLPEDVLERHLLKKLPQHLDRKSGTDVHVIVSTKSGIGLAQSFFEAVFKPLFSTAAGSLEHETHSFGLTLTTSAQTVRQFAEEKLGGRGKDAAPQTVVLLSGDGGIVDLLNSYDPRTSAAASPPTVAVLPLGTGNALFHSVNKPHYTSSDPGRPAPSPLVLALRTLFRDGRPQPLPTFEAAFTFGSRLISYTGDTAAVEAGQAREEQTAVAALHGAIVASYGFHAQLVWESDTPEYRKHGAARFGMVAKELLGTSHAYDAGVAVVLPGATAAEELAPGRRFGYVLATMVSNLEKTFAISPAGQPLDGKLRLVHFGDVGAEKTMEVMMAAYNNGSHVGMKWEGGSGKEENVGYDEIDEVKVTINEEDARWRKVCIDGTIVEIPKGGSMTVKKSLGSGFNLLTMSSVA